MICDQLKNYRQMFTAHEEYRHSPFTAAVAQARERERKRENDKGIGTSFGGRYKRAEGREEKIVLFLRWIKERH